MANWLAAQPNAPTELWVSTAVRAQATAAYFAQALMLQPEAVHSFEEMYHASVETLVGLAQICSSDCQSLALVAHNPGLTYLVNWLAPASVTDNLPTCGIAGFQLPDDWQNNWTNLALAQGTAELTHYMTPK